MLTNLNITYLQHVFKNIIANPNTSHETIKITAIIMVEKLTPSSNTSNNLSNEPMFSNTSHETIKITAIIMVEKLTPSSNTSNNLSNEPMFSKYFINLQNHGIPRSFYCFKKIIDYMIRLSFVIQKMHNENKCSNFAMDIHKSKFMVQELQNFTVLIMNFSLVFFTILNKISLTMFHLDGKINWGFCFRTS